MIGAGTMGVGIAQVFAQNSEFNVLLCSSNICSAESGKKKIEKSLKTYVVKGKKSLKDVDNILLKIKVGIIEDCKDCDIVIESIPENLQKKQMLFKKLQNICKADCIFLTNTSSLSITEIGTDILQSVVGMHFFNPAPIMKLVEITPGLNTKRQITEKVIRIAENLGKKPIEVKECPGFIVNRILMPMINEAIGLYAEGITTVEVIDAAMQLGANHPLGPLKLSDFIGLDVCLTIMEVLWEKTGDLKYCPHPLLKTMVDNGWLGRKSGKGFYIYNK